MSRNMTHKIASIQARECRYEIIHDSREQYNRYKLYTVTLVRDPSVDWPRWKESRRLQEKYADLTSCLAWISDDMHNHRWTT